MPGFFESDDGEWMVIRFSAFFQAFREGQFPVRFLDRLNFGYGYPVPNFLYPGFMYVSTIIHILGFNFVDTIKVLIGLSIILSGVFSFVWLRKIHDDVSALIGSLMYVYMPYHLFDFFKRGSVGELLAISILPFILWQVERGSLFLISLGIGFLIISHNTLALLFLGFISIYMLMKVLSTGYKKIYFKYLAALVLGFGLSAFFSIPAFLELQNTVFRSVQVSNYKNYFATLDLIGIGSAITILLVLYLILSKRIRVEKKESVLLATFIICISSIVLSTQLGGILWNIIPVGFIQFPFRVLSLTLITLSLLASAVIYYIPKNIKYVVAFLLFLTILFSAYPQMSYRQINKEEGFYFTNEDTTTVGNEYMPIWVKEKPQEHYVQKVEFKEGNGDINLISHGSKKITFTVNSSSASSVLINTIYYPGWVGKVNGVDKEIIYDNTKGIMSISLDKGQNGVELEFKETEMRNYSNWVSIISLIVLCVFQVIILKKKI